MMMAESVWATNALKGLGVDEKAQGRYRGLIVINSKFEPMRIAGKMAGYKGRQLGTNS